MRDPSDPLFSANVLETSSSLENLLGQIRMILFTNKGDVIGAYDFGFNLEDQLFLFNLNAQDLQVKLREAIYAYCPDATNFNIKVDVQFFAGSVRDVCLIDIWVDDQKMIGVIIK